jgi:hypothetical protein
MTLGEARQLCTILYYTATETHNVDDRQWAVLLDVMNKKYWNEVSRATGSIYAKDTTDTISDQYGQWDFGGSVFAGNDLTAAQSMTISTNTGWAISNGGVSPNVALGPDGTMSASLFYANSSSVTTHYMGFTSIMPSYLAGQGAITVYAKAGTAQYLWLSSDGTTNIQYYDLLNGVLGSSGGSIGTCSISAAPNPGFGYTVSTTSSSSPLVSPTGWYKCVFKPHPTITAGLINLGMTTTDNTLSTSITANTGLYIYGPRRAYTDNMVDPIGVHMPMAVELKYFGRYIKLDYEIPQDRYIYNIAFGQVQVLIPSAWTLMGEKVILLPRVSGTQVLRMTYIPRLADLTDDTQQLLGGKLPTYHPLIAYEVAASMLPKDAERSNVVGPLTELRAQFKNYLQSRQRQDGRKIRFVPYE